MDKYFAELYRNLFQCTHVFNAVSYESGLLVYFVVHVVGRNEGIISLYEDFFFQIIVIYFTRSLVEIYGRLQEILCSYYSQAVLFSSEFLDPAMLQWLPYTDFCTGFRQMVPWMLKCVPWELIMSHCPSEISMKNNCTNNDHISRHVFLGRYVIWE